MKLEILSLCVITFLSTLMHEARAAASEQKQCKETGILSLLRQALCFSDSDHQHQDRPHLLVNSDDESDEEENTAKQSALTSKQNRIQSLPSMKMNEEDVLCATLSCSVLKPLIAPLSVVPGPEKACIAGALCLGCSLHACKKCADKRHVCCQSAACTND